MKGNNKMNIEHIEPFLKYMYGENNAIWAGQLSYKEFLRRSDLYEYERMELEVPGSIVYFLYNKNTHKLYTRGKLSVTDVIEVMRKRLNIISEGKI